MPRTDLSESEFKKIKKLLALGVKTKAISETTGRSAASVSKVDATPNFREFNKRVGRTFVRKPKPQAQVQAELPISAGLPLEDVYTKLEELESLIHQVIKKLDGRVADKRKRSWL